MAQLNTRILLKYDSYSNWIANNPVLLAGEVAIATIPVADGATSLNHNSVALPQVLIKVGDGTSHYNTLPFASALAADVHPWAKESQADFETRVKTLVAGLHYTKAEVYNKSEIDAFLAQYYKKTEIDAITGALADLNTTNKNNLVAAINEALQAVEVGGTGSVVSVIKEETATEGSLATYKVTQGGNAVGTLIEVVKDTALEGRVATVEGVLPTLETKENVKTVADNLAAYIESNDAALAGVKTTAEAARTEAQVDAQIDAKITALDLANTYDAKGAAAEIAEDLAEYVESNNAAIADRYTKTEADAKFAVKGEDAYDDEEVRGLIADNAQAIATEKSRAEGIEAGLRTDVDAIKGDYLKAADKTALQEQITANANAITTITNGIDPDKIDGLNDLITWADEHAPEVNGIKTDIAANTKAIEDEVTRATGVEAGFETRIATLESATTLEDAKAYTDAREVEIKKYADQAEADAITAAANDAAEKYETKGTAQGLINELNIAQYETVAGAADKYETKGTAQTLVNGLGIADYLKSADAATTYETKTDASAKLEAAKKHADDINTALVARLAVLEGIDHTVYETKTDATAKLAEAKKHTDDSITALNVAQYAKTADLKAVATTGDIKDLSQGENEYVVFYCGDSAKFVGLV